MTGNTKMKRQRCLFKEAQNLLGRHVNSYNIIHGALGTKNAYMPKKIRLTLWMNSFDGQEMQKQPTNAKI